MPRLQFSEAKGSQFLLKKKKHWLHSDTDTEDRKRFENKISAVRCKHGHIFNIIHLNCLL